MKAQLPRAVLRTGFVAGALGLAYLAGLSQRVMQQEVAANLAAAKKQAKAVRAEAEANSRPKLTRDEVWQRMQDELKKSTEGWKIWNELSSNLEAGDFAFIVEQLAKFPQSSQRDELLQFCFRNGLDQSDPAAALSLVEFITDPRLRRDIFAQALSSLARKDPDRARQELASLPPGPQSLDAYGVVFGTLADQAKLAPAAADEAFNLPAGSNRTAAMMGVVESWARHDIPGLLDWAGELPASDSAVLKAALLDAGTGQLFTSPQPQLVSKYLGKLENASDRNEIIEKIAGAMVTAQGDGSNYHEFTFGSFSGSEEAPSEQNASGQTTSWIRAGEALDWLNQVATGETYTKSVQSVFSSLGDFEVDPKMVDDVLGKVTEPELRAAAFAEIAGIWGRDDPQAALTWAQSLSATDSAASTQALNFVVEQWGDDDPKAALSWAQIQAADGNPPVESKFLSTVVSNWATWDPAAAAAFVQNAPDPSPYLDAAETVVTFLAEEKPAPALTFAESLPAGPDKNKALSSVLSQIADYDFSSAWQEILGLPSGPDRDVIMGNLIVGETDRDPANAAGLIGQLTDPRAQIEATKALTQTWVRADSRGATAWVNSLAPGDLRDSAVGQLVAAQMNTDPAAALVLAGSMADPHAQAAQVQAIELSAQINQLPPGGPRDSAILQLLPIQLQTDPQGALAWAATLSNPQERSKQLQAAFVTWGTMSPETTKAEQDIEETGFVPGDSSIAAIAYRQLTQAERDAVRHGIAAITAKTSIKQPAGQ